MLESKASHREIILERKDRNARVKEKLFRSVAMSEPEFVLVGDAIEAKLSKASRLEWALQRALDW